MERTGIFRQLWMVCFQSTNTSCETYRQEAGSSRKLMQETEAQLGVAPKRFLPFGRLTLLTMDPLLFYFSSFKFLWELKNLFFWLQGYKSLPQIPCLFPCCVPRPSPQPPAWVLAVLTTGDLPFSCYPSFGGRSCPRKKESSSPLLCCYKRFNLPRMGSSECLRAWKLACSLLKARLWSSVSLEFFMEAR